MLKRYSHNPIICPKDIKMSGVRFKDVSSVFNPGATFYNNKYILLLRVQSRGRRTFIVKGSSLDGLNFKISESPIVIKKINLVKDEIYHIYDPRITKINNKYFIIVAMDLDIGCRLGLIITEDFENFIFKGIISNSTNRNGVLFPEKINNKFVRLERPNNAKGEGILSGNQIHVSNSNDCMNWTNSNILLEGNPHFWDELIGAGTPPIKTIIGWLFLYHGVATHFSSSNIYQVGVAILDIKNPNKLLYRSTQNILEPRELYEQVGQVSNVVFPTGMIVENYNEDGYAEIDSKVNIYYGAADTCVGLAFSTVGELIKMAKNEI